MNEQTKPKPTLIRLTMTVSVGYSPEDGRIVSCGTDVPNGQGWNPRIGPHQMNDVCRLFPAKLPREANRIARRRKSESL